MATKQSTHRGSVSKPSLGWGWSEALHETSTHWVSHVQTSKGKTIKYRKKDGKCVGGEDILDLTSIKESLK